MRRRSHLKVLGPLLLVLAAGYGCAADPDAASDDPIDKAESRLLADTGVPWIVTTHDNKEIRLVAPTKPVRVGTGSPEEMARTFFAKYRDMFHGTGKPDELRLKDQSVDPDTGATHVRFAHYLPGTDIPVLETSSVADFTAAGELYIAQPSFRADLETVPTKAGVSEGVARASALVAAAAQCAAPQANFPVPSMTLGVDGDEMQPARLVWRAEFASPVGTCAAPVATVDATTGTAIEAKDEARYEWDTEARGVRYYPPMNETKPVRVIDVTPVIEAGKAKRWVLRSESPPLLETREFSTGVSFGMTINRENEISTTEKGKWDSNPVKGADVDAHYHGYQALKFYSDKFGRNGADGKGTKLTLVVHDSTPDVVKGIALFSTTDLKLHFSDGNVASSGNLLPSSAGLDVVTHELGHAIIHQKSRLIDSGEPSALNESFGDAMGAYAEYWSRTISYQSKIRPNPVVMGEAITVDGKGIRNMQKPTFSTLAAYKDACPSGVGVRGVCEVHAVSTLPTYAFYLMVSGGAHPNGTKVPSLGWDSAGKLWFAASINLTSRSTFKEAAVRHLQEAQQRFPTAFQSELCAWSAIGVLDAGFMSKYSLRCAPQPEVSCAGRSDGYVCSSGLPYSVLECRGGKHVSTRWCEKIDTEWCKRTSPDDPTAVLDSENKFVCEKPQEYSAN